MRVKQADRIGLHSSEEASVRTVDNRTQRFPTKRREVPNGDDTTGSGGSDQSPIRTKRRFENERIVAQGRESLDAAIQIPDARGIVIARGEKKLLIRTELDAVHGSIVVE